MLQRPRRPLPRRFRRRVSPTMRAFVRRRHATRGRSRAKIRLQRAYRRSERTVQVTVQFVRRWFLWMLLAVTILAFILLLFSPVLRIREMRVQRSEARLDVERVQELLLPLFGRHLLFLTRGEVAGLMREAVPDLDTVTVSKNFPSELVVRVTLKPFAARLAIQEPPQPKSATGATAPAPGAGTGAAVKPEKRFGYLTTNNIYVSLPTEDAKAASLPLITVTDWAVRPASGAPLFPAGLLERMNEAEQALTAEFGQKITTRTVYLRAREFHLSTGKISFWFDMQSPLSEQLGRFRIFLQTIGLGQVKMYVDLRLAGKVVYR